MYGAIHGSFVRMAFCSLGAPIRQQDRMLTDFGFRVHSSHIHRRIIGTRASVDLEKVMA
jgi:hypothetical protein